MNIRLLALIAASLAGIASARAGQLPVLELDLQDHLFRPDKIEVPAGSAFELHVTNHDATPAEIESSDMKFEKVIAGNSDIRLRVKALPPGVFVFYDDYHRDSTHGDVTAR